MPEKTLIVATNARKKDVYADPVYMSVAHDGRPKHYAMITVEDGVVTNRDIVTSRSKVETAMRDTATYRGGVIVDERCSDRNFLPLKVPSHARTMDIATFRRAKSDEELTALHDIRTLTLRQLNVANPTERTFRSSSNGHRSAFQRLDGKGFVQYRGGFRDAAGRCADLTRVDAKNDDWYGRVQRVYRGLDDVYANLYEGKTVEELNRIFLRHVDTRKDKVYGNVVRSTGTEVDEKIADFRKLNRYDYVTVGVVAGDGKENAVFYRNSGTPKAPKVVEATYSSLLGNDERGVASAHASPSVEGPSASTDAADAMPQGGGDGASTGEERVANLVHEYRSVDDDVEREAVRDAVAQRLEDDPQAVELFYRRACGEDAERLREEDVCRRLLS